MRKGYDNVALFYDRLARLVFGNKQEMAQYALLGAIMPADNILIVGGGRGKILEHIARLHPAGLSITFIDASAKMVALAKEKEREQNKVTFIAAPVESVQLSSDYDVVITPFFFDNFLQPQADSIFRQLNSCLRGRARWLHTDFSNTADPLQRFTLQLMYRFFGVLCGVAARQLPDMQTNFTNSGYRPVQQVHYMRGFIAATAYERNK